MRQRIFAHVLEKKSKTGEGWLRELISGFKLSPRVPPLPGIVKNKNESLIKLWQAPKAPPEPCQASRETKKKMTTTRSNRPCATVGCSCDCTVLYGARSRPWGPVIIIIGNLHSKTLLPSIIWGLYVRSSPLVIEGLGAMFLPGTTPGLHERPDRGTARLRGLRSLKGSGSRVGEYAHIHR